MDPLLARLAARLRAERLTRGWTLEHLATASGVSRSMISDVERGTRTPTVLVTARLATALGVTVSRLLGEDRTERVVLIRHGQQAAITDRTGWQRRVLSPNLPGVEFEFIRTAVPPRVSVGEFAPHAPGSREYVAVESGELTVTLDGTPHRLSTGDSLYYAGDCTHSFANPGTTSCIYYTAMQVSGPAAPAPAEVDVGDGVGADGAQPIGAARTRPPHDPNRDQPERRQVRSSQSARGEQH